MKTLCYTILVVSFFSVVSCKQSNGTSGFVLDNVPTMRVSDIFRKDSVQAFAMRVSEENQALSFEYFEKAEKLKKSNFTRALYCYKRAITLNPNDRFYTTLGNVLKESEQYDEAGDYYEMAVDLNPNQSEEQYYEIIQNTLFMKDGYKIFAYLNQYNQLNYSRENLNEAVLGNTKVKNKLSANKVSDFVVLMNGIWQETTEQSEVSEKSESEGAPFSEYIKQFETISLPFEGNTKMLQKFIYNNGGDYEFEDYDANKDFHKYEEYGLFKTSYYTKTDFQYFVGESNGNLLFIQAVDTSSEAVPRDFRCIYHRLVVYSSTGKFLDSKIIGIHAGNVLQTYIIQPDLSIREQEFERVWRKPFSRYDINNEITSTELKAKRLVKLTPEGKFVEEEELMP